ncbi:hypothetical protein NKG94_06065 [Micromonospora sp. M12]
MRSGGRDDEPLLPARAVRPAGEPAGAGHDELRRRRVPRRVRQDRGGGRADLPAVPGEGGNLIDTADFYTAGESGGSSAA